MLLSMHSLKQALSIGSIIHKDGYTSDVKLNNQKSASLDLTISYIYLPTEEEVRSDDREALEKHRVTEYELEPGEVVLVEVKERFAMPTDKAGVVFPPNSLSKRGLIMTNPGHIDPGFKGLISLCLVNMGKKAVPLNAGSVICRLLVFKLTTDSPGYHTTGNGIERMQYNSIGQDFATINDKALNAVKKYFSRILPIYAVVLTGLLGIIAVTIPILSSISERYFVENNIQKSVSEKIEETIQPDLDKLRKEIKAIKENIDVLCKNEKQSTCNNKELP